MSKMKVILTDQNVEIKGTGMYSSKKISEKDIKYEWKHALEKELNIENTLILKLFSNIVNENLYSDTDYDFRIKNNDTVISFNINEDNIEDRESITSIEDLKRIGYTFFEIQYISDEDTYR